MSKSSFITEHRRKKEKVLIIARFFTQYKIVGGIVRRALQDSTTHSNGGTFF